MFPLGNVHYRELAPITGPRERFDVATGMLESIPTVSNAL